MNLNINLENGDSSLFLGNSLLETLTLNDDNGNIQAEFTGNQSLLEKVNIEQSNGDILLTLSGDYPSLSNIAVESDNGATNAEFSGNYFSLNDVKIKSNNGEIVAKLTGNWSQDSNMEVMTDNGGITLQLPTDIGVYVEVIDPMSVEATGLRQEGNAYFNDAYGKSEKTLKIKVSSSNGNVKLQLTD